MNENKKTNIYEWNTKVYLHDVIKHFKITCL